MRQPVQISSYNVCNVIYLYIQVRTRRLRFAMLQIYASQSPPGNNILTAAVTDVCVNYCTGGNCTSECRNGSTSNPFRINNIVNGTNYTISLSLRSDFGQSGESAPEVYGEDKYV